MTLKTLQQLIEEYKELLKDLPEEVIEHWIERCLEYDEWDEADLMIKYDKENAK